LKSVIWIHKDLINLGYATETASALTKVGFEIHQAARMEIHCDPRNAKSAAVPHKLGYTLEATLRKQPPSLDNWRDSEIWTILQEEYPNSLLKKSDIEAYGAANRRII